MNLQKIKILSWNTKGLGGMEKCNVVKNIIKEARCDICCLQETKWSTDDPSCHAKALPNFFEKRCASLLARGTKGGVIISWKRNYTLLNSWATLHTISALLKQESTGGTFLITAVYGPSIDDAAIKREFIKELRNLAVGVHHPWILLGDFNLVRWRTDRPGDPRGMSLMILFNDIIRDLEMVDVPLKNRAYTWCNKQPTPSFSKLDRILMSPTWSLHFPIITLNVLDMAVSDHCPLLLSCNQQRTTKKEAKWENFWFTYAEVHQMVNKMWGEGPLSMKVGL